MKTLNIFKKISWKVRYDTGDMPYPPVIFWKDTKINDIYNAWKKTVKYIKKSKNNHNMGLYVHIPFCYSRCFYCTCVTKTSHDVEEYSRYLDLVELECKKFSEIFNGIKFNTVYVGGGTPSILTSKQIDRFYNILNKYFDLSDVAQIMTEGSPYTIDEEKLKTLAKHGVKKMTLGVQSLDSKVLKINNRPQETTYLLKMVPKARQLGIKYINIDIMAGIPGQDIEGFKETLKLVENEIKPDTIHVNAFWPTRRTSFIKSGGVYTNEDIKLRNKLRLMGHGLAEKSHGDSDHEADNIQLFNAKNYNSSILGIGLGAISHAFGELHYAKETMEDYKLWLLNNKNINFNGYKLDIEDEQISYVINNFRNGVYYDKFYELFLVKLEDTFLYEKILKLEGIGLIIKENEYGKYFKSKVNSEVISDIYSKYFYKNVVIKDFIKKFNVNGSEFKDIDFKLKQLYAD